MEHLFDVYSLRPEWEPSLPGEDAEGIRSRRDVVDVLVRELWIQIAAQAWRFYTLHGRGMMFLDFNEILRTVGDGRVAHPYIVAAETRNFAMSAREAEILGNALRSYDPERGIIALGRFATANVTVNVFRRAAHQPPPPQAARAERN